MRLAVAALLLAEITVPPGPQPRIDVLHTLAESHAVVLIATKLCDDLFARKEANDLQAALGLTNADLADAYALIVRFAAEMNADAHKVGV